MKVLEAFLEVLTSHPPPSDTDVRLGLVISALMKVR